MSIDISLLPRADLPVIWDDFKAKAELVRATAETLTVTCITQKEEMALARKTRLTLREIRIAVEHKRVELGEGHLKEIQKVNGAAKAIREFIEPLEARLLIQEEFAERAEEKRIADLATARYLEAAALRPHFQGTNMGRMLQEDFDALLVNLRQEKAEIEAANRLRVEVESRLAESKAEAIREATAARAEAEIRLAAERAKAEAARILAQQERDAEAWRVQQERVAADGRLAEARAEQKRLNEEAERVRAEQEAKHRAELSAVAAQRTLEREAEEKRRQEDLRIEREKTAVLEAELAQANAAKVAEEKRLRDIEVAPDAAKLIAYVDAVRSVSIPVLHSKEANTIFNKVAHTIAAACGELRIFGQ